MFRKMPCSIWFAGFVVQVVALYLLYHLALGHYGVLFDSYREGHWWQYLIAVLMLLFGICFMHAGKVETVVFDNEKGLVSKIKTSIFCRKKTEDFALEQIRNVRVFKRGHDGVQVVTIRYDVQIDFTR